MPDKHDHPDKYPLDAASTTHGPMYPLADAEAAAARPPETPPLRDLAVETPAAPLDEPARRALAAATGAPEFMLPWLDRFYDPADAGLVLAVANRALGAKVLDERTLDRAVRRAVLDRDAHGLVTPSSFHARFEMWAFFEGWLDVPADVRRAAQRVGARRLHRARSAPACEAVRDGRPDEGDQGDYTFLLLPEAEELIRAAPHVYLWPCNCRAMWGNCAKDLNVCLRFDNARNVGWELNADHAVAVLREADRHGSHAHRLPGQPCTAITASATAAPTAASRIVSARAAGRGRPVAGAPARGRRRRAAVHGLRPLPPSAARSAPSPAGKGARRRQSSTRTRAAAAACARPAAPTARSRWRRCPAGGAHRRPRRGDLDVVVLPSAGHAPP